VPHKSFSIEQRKNGRLLLVLLVIERVAENTVNVAARHGVAAAFLDENGETDQQEKSDLNLMDFECLQDSSSTMIINSFVG
jgi:hypothetical protein